MPINFFSAWDFGDPDASRARFEELQNGANSEDWSILQTQIARAYGMGRDFEIAREKLAEIDLGSLTPHATALYHLELGRTFLSLTHNHAQVSPDDREAAIEQYQLAHEFADQAQEDGFAIDALHMLAICAETEEEKVRLNKVALERAESSLQEAGIRWRASLNNNIGYTLYGLNRFEDALSHFQMALQQRMEQGNETNVRIAKWMVAWTLRAMNRLDDALEMQLALEQECDAVGQPDEYVFEELEAIYRARGEDERADHYSERVLALRKQ